MTSGMYTMARGRRAAADAALHSQAMAPGIVYWFTYLQVYERTVRSKRTLLRYLAAEVFQATCTEHTAHVVCGSRASQLELYNHR